MSGLQNATVRSPGRRVVIAAAIAVASVFMISPTVSAAALGSTGAALGCGAGLDLVPLATIPAHGSYTVPGAGFITEWSTLAGTTNLGKVGLLVWRPVSPGPFQLLGATATTALQPGITNTFPVAPAIPVQLGDVIGMRIEGATDCAQLGDLLDTVGSTPGPVATNAIPAPTAWAKNSSMFLNLAATFATSITPPPPPAPTPKTKDDCKNDGWQHFVDAAGNPFNNQGACVSFVEALNDNEAEGDQSSGDSSTGDQSTGTGDASTEQSQSSTADQG